MSESGCLCAPDPDAAFSCLLVGWDSDRVIGFLMLFFHRKISNHNKEIAK